MHPFTDSRLIRGRFNTSFADLEGNPDKFFFLLFPDERSVI